MYRRQITSSQAQHPQLGLLRIPRLSPLHVHHDYQLDASVEQPAIHGDTLIQSVQQTEIMANRLGRNAGFEDVETRVEHHMVLELVSFSSILGFCRACCREEGDMKGVVVAAHDGDGCDGGSAIHLLVLLLVLLLVMFPVIEYSWKQE